MDAFWNSLQDKLIKQASGAGEEYALNQGNLTKGKWKILPNPAGGNTHVWTVGDTVLAGPPNLLGKKLKDIQPEDLQVEDKQMSQKFPSKYDAEINQLAMDKTMNAGRRAKAVERLQEKARSEHNMDGSLGFFPNNEGVVETPNMSSRMTSDQLAEKQQALERTKKLDDLAARFAANKYGTDPEQQKNYHNQRLQHMEELKGILGEGAHSTIDNAAATSHNALQRLSPNGQSPIVQGNTSEAEKPAKKTLNPRNVAPPTEQTPVVDNTQEEPAPAVAPINPSGVPPETESTETLPEEEPEVPKTPKKPGYWSKVWDKFNPNGGNAEPQEDFEEPEIAQAPETVQTPQAPKMPVPNTKTPSIPKTPILKPKPQKRLDFEDNGTHHYMDNNHGNISIGDNNNQNIGNNSNVGNIYRAFLLNNENRLIMPSSKSKKTQ